MRQRKNRPNWTLEGLENRALLAATVIDVMVLYSTDARAQFGNNDAAIQKAIRQSIDIANLAHLNTQDNIVLRLVHTGHLVYSNPGASKETQLAALSANATAATLRNTHGADLVSMIGQVAGGGGLADAMPSPAGNSTEAFSVVGHESIGPGSLVLAHELGHNQGAGHERDNGVEYAEGVFPDYSFGYHAFGQNGTDYGDVMSYQGSRLPVFAWPGFSWQGTPIGSAVGNADAANLNATFLATGPVIAAYRPTVAANAAPTATLIQSDLVGDQLTFQVRYLDDITVNASTIGNGDAYVTTPEGFKLAAEFVSINTAGDAYAVTATYRVTLPKNLPALSSLVFGLNASQVRDTDNVAVAGGTIANNLDTDLDRGLIAFPLARNTGELSPGTTRRLTQSIGESSDRQDVFRFTVNQNMNVNLRVSGIGGNITSDITLFLFHDANLSEDNDGGEGLGNSQESGFADRTMSEALTPGTYYVYLQTDAGDPQSNYTLTIQNVDNTQDVTPPSLPVLDKIDSVHAGTINTVDLYVVYRDDVGVDPNSVLLGGYVEIYNPTGSGIIKTPTDISVSGKNVIAHYTHTFASGFGSGNVTVQLSDFANFESEVTDLAGNPIGGLGTTLGTYRVGTLPTDTTLPTALLHQAEPILIPNSSNYDFIVAYKENRGMSLGTLDNNDILVDGPAGSGITNLPATRQPYSISPGGALIYTPYRITPPGGSWDYTDNGTWTIKLAANQVRDIHNNAAAANNNVGTFLVQIAIPGDGNGDNVVNHLDFNILHANFGQHGRGVATGDVNFDGIVNFADFQILERMFGTSQPLASESILLAAARPTKAAVTKVFSTAVVSRPPQKTPVRRPAPLKR